MANARSRPLKEVMGGSIMVGDFWIRVGFDGSRRSKTEEAEKESVQILIRSVLGEHFRRGNCDFVSVGLAASAADITMAMGIAQKEREDYEKCPRKRNLASFAAIRPKVPDGKSRWSSFDEVRERVFLLRLAFDGTHVLRDHRLEVRRVRSLLRFLLDRAYCEGIIDFAYGPVDDEEWEYEERRDAVLMAWRKEEEEERKRDAPDVVVLSD